VGLVSTPEAAQRVGLSFRQIDHYVRTHAVYPTSAAAGSGSKRGWSADDVERLRLIAAATASITSGNVPSIIPIIGCLWRWMDEEGLPARWALVGRDNGTWAVSADDPTGPHRSGLLVVP